MHCVGCWAGEYGNKNNLSFDDMDKIVTQGKELGVYLYMLTGGEPLVRKKDVLKLAEKQDVYKRQVIGCSLLYLFLQCTSYDVRILKSCETGVKSISNLTI